MKTLVKFVVCACFVAVAALATAPPASAEEGGRWVKHRMFDGYDMETAERLARDLNANGGRDIRRGSAVAVPSTTPGRFAVDVDRWDTTPQVIAVAAISDSLRAPAPTQRGIKIHAAIRVTPGARLVIDLKSGSGATADRRALPGFFDSVILVEDEQADAQGNRRQLEGGANDDVSWPTDCNSRVTVTAPASGLIRVVVTSYHEGESGPYTVSFRPE